jgi:D-alanyl-D-alanine carboxypeptidase
MKSLTIKYILLLATLFSCSPYISDLVITGCADQSNTSSFSKAAGVTEAVQELVRDGVPGCAVTVYSSEGWWSTAAGYAKIENKTPMQNCQLQYLQSVAKTYMAVGILKLYEQGKIDLDAPMTKYLPEKFSRHIRDGSTVTVKMLLNHTSGIPEYNLSPAYVTKLIQHPAYAFEPEEYLKYIHQKPLDFKPGSKYSYRNTNYLILALIADAITGDHAKYLDEVIFQPLQLTNTFYRNDNQYLKYPNLVNSYWDRYSDGILENASVLQRNNVAALIGDDGIVATTEDAVKFLKGLMEEKIISHSTLELMKSWEKDSKGNPTYGLGLDYATFNGKIGYGHSGGGIGAGCQLYYFPEKEIYIFAAINLGTVTDSPIHEAAGKSIEKIYEELLKD